MNKFKKHRTNIKDLENFTSINARSYKHYQGAIGAWYYPAPLDDTEQAILNHLNKLYSIMNKVKIMPIFDV